MKLDPGTVKSLEKLLTAEISEYDSYLQLLEQEQQAVIKLDADTVTNLGLKRGEVVDRLSQLKDERSKVIASAIGNDAYRASDVIQEGCAPADRKRLMSLVEKVKTRVQQVEKKSREFNQVLSFSLGLVNGELSLLWSASQPVTRVYNAFGSMTQGVQPTPPRNGSLLGEA